MPSPHTAGTGKPIVIFGLGELPGQSHDCFARHAGRKVDAFNVGVQYPTEDQADGLPVLAFDEAQRRFPSSMHVLFVAIGCLRFNQVRKGRG
jgi:hypothetical protein